VHEPRRVQYLAGLLAYVKPEVAEAKTLYDARSAGRMEEYRRRLTFFSPSTNCTSTQIREELREDSGSTDARGRVRPTGRSFAGSPASIGTVR
jgi:hypothetical protein